MWSVACKLHWSEEVSDLHWDDVRTGVAARSIGLANGGEGQGSLCGKAGREGGR
jgi:hypothetical protein